MKNNAKVIGMLIRKYRLEQNISQEGLCQGICAVSYLSKIEKGNVLGSLEIISRLFEVLGISVPDNSQSLEPYGEKIKDYFRYFFLSNFKESESIMSELHSRRHVLIHSYLAIDLMLAEAYYSYNNYKDKATLKPLLMDLLKFEDYMDNSQTNYLYLLLGMFETYISNDYIAALNYYTLAQNRKTDGIVLDSLATVHYALGDYFESITLGDEAYRRLMEDGNVGRASNLCFVIAAAYSNIRNPNKSVQYYNRILALTKDQNQRGQVYYNIGSTFLVHKEYNKALHNLKQAYDIIENHSNNEPSSYLLLLQKLFLTYMSLDKKDKAKIFLSLASDFYQGAQVANISDSLKSSLKWMNLMFKRNNYLQDEEYLQSIKTTYYTSLKDSHHGLQIFYGNYLIEAYKTHRKYKDALKVTESLYVKK